MSQVGNNIPDLHCSAVIDGKEINENFCLGDLVGRYLIIFFYPSDFTFVCPTELHAFQDKLPEFTKRGCQVVGCSVDSVYSHLAWLETPMQKGGIQGVTYPLLSDIKKEISRAFEVLKEDQGCSYRATFLVDKAGVIRHSSVNDLPLGRSIDEILRLLDALQHVEAHGEVCPAGWQKGGKSMNPTVQGLKDYFDK